MAKPSTTRKEYGDNLFVPGIRQPNETITLDSYGVMQAQLTFALDSEASNMRNAIAYYSSGVDYPDNLGCVMKSYKYHITSAKGGVSMFVVDYMGILGDTQSRAQITGIANCTAQPIETHPNFQVFNDKFADGPLAGKPPYDPLAEANVPLWVEQKNADDLVVGYKFNGFGINEAGDLNIKAGIRQFMRPMTNVRGVIFFDSANGYKGANFANSVGQTIYDGDLQYLFNPLDVVGAQAATNCLLVSANIECLGDPNHYAAIKVTYDVMIGGELGWDPDIYAQMEESLFS
ncbi:hypothetical protein UFOVP201_32 [uncultured Caudovirales phage]|uniref:Uncharacterized protein n=1 Tax=uncultured Caudovirales phage TaxID=2100421 RepID=A0A6J7WMR1_9CAUD|nr:hypothetical protein UFOVP201_32 [uncultured Caudovirales phage]